MPLHKTSGRYRRNARVGLVNGLAMQATELQSEPLLRRILRNDVRYMKGGVMLADFTPTCIQQGELFVGE